MSKFNKITHFHIIYWLFLAFMTLGMMIWYSVITSKCNEIFRNGNYTVWEPNRWIGITNNGTPFCKNIPQFVIWTSFTASIIFWVGIEIFVIFMLRNRPLASWETEPLSLKFGPIRITNWSLFIFGLQLEEDSSDSTTITEEEGTKEYLEKDNIPIATETNVTNRNYDVPLAIVVS